MGQRHQVYLRTKPRFYNKGNVNNKNAQTLGIHHQWLYGHTAIRLLHNFLNFASIDLSNKSYSSLDDPEKALEILKHAYSFDPAIAYHHSVHDITGETTDDPRNGDNNNGITVIDFEDGKLKYCFLSVGHLECMHETVHDPYYDEDSEGKTLTYKNFEPIDVKQWMNLHYGKDWNKGDADSLEIQKLIDFVSSFELLSVKRLAEIFPDMVSKDKEKGLYLTPNSVDFIKKKKVSKKKGVINERPKRTASARI
jgi:hypothetical protein